MKGNRLLFGGALMAAGLAAQSAKADFVFSYSATEVGAYAYGGDGGPTYDAFTGAGFWSVFTEDADPAGGALASASSDGTALSIRLNTYTTGYAGAFANLTYSYFTVDRPTLADVSWSFDAGFGYVSVYNITDNITLVSEFVGAGATVVSLEVGKEYFAQGQAFSFQGGGKAFVDIVIPAPAAALPLLAAGGLLSVSRRRRRE